MFMGASVFFWIIKITRVCPLESLSSPPEDLVEKVTEKNTCNGVSHDQFSSIDPEDALRRMLRTQLTYLILVPIRL